MGHQWHDGFWRSEDEIRKIENDKTILFWKIISALGPVTLLAIILNKFEVSGSWFSVPLWTLLAVSGLAHLILGVVAYLVGAGSWALVILIALTIGIRGGDTVAHGPVKSKEGSEASQEKSENNSGGNRTRNNGSDNKLSNMADSTANTKKLANGKSPEGNTPVDPIMEKRSHEISFLQSEFQRLTHIKAGINAVGSGLEGKVGTIAQESDAAVTFKDTTRATKAQSSIRDLRKELSAWSKQTADFFKEADAYNLRLKGLNGATDAPAALDVSKRDGVDGACKKVNAILDQFEQKLNGVK